MPFPTSILTLLTATLTLGLSLFPTFVSATCFNTGAYWDDKEPALQAAASACDGHLHGVYLAGESKRACANGTDGKKIEFNIFNMASEIRKLGPTECRDGLAREVVGCERGGKTSYIYWEFT
ncbi:MAG: hypothetical protein M1816_003531 [Peltula sp. TS41687]|nr:MAG: hypothetical protein M1816_003531 [Peltula sp. TS41687]